MAPGLDLTTFDPMLKQHYAPGVVLNLAMYRNKALGLMNKSHKKPGGGRSWTQPVQYGLPGGGSSDFGTAIAATNNQSQYGVFTVPRTRHYRLARVDNETIEASVEDMDAFDTAFDEFDRAMQAEANYMNFRLFRSRGGAIGRMTNSSFASAVITLDDPSAVWGVRKGDVLGLSSADGTTGALRAGSLTVLSVQRAAGTITCTGNISAGVAAAAQNDYLFLAGDFGGAAAGFIDWIPDAAPSATTFYGLDRSTEPEMLGGCRVDGTDGRPTHETLVDMVAQLDSFGAGDDLIAFMNPLATASLSKQLEGKWVIMQASGTNGSKVADIGYRGWQVTLEGHQVTIMTERACQKSRVWMLSEDTWTMFSAGAAPNFLMKRAGSIILPSQFADAYDARIGEYWNLACKGPGLNCNGQLPA